MVDHAASPVAPGEIPTMITLAFYVTVSDSRAALPAGHAA